MTCVRPVLLRSVPSCRAVASLACAVLVFGGVVAGCSSDEDVAETDPSAVTAEPTTTTPTEASPSTDTPPASPTQTYTPEEQPIIDAYHAFYEAVDKPVDTIDEFTTNIKDVTHPEYRDHITKTTAASLAAGEVTRGRSKHLSLTVERIGAQQALLQACQDNSEVTVTSADNPAEVTRGKPRVSKRVLLDNIDGRWVG